MTDENEKDISNIAITTRELSLDAILIAQGLEHQKSLRMALLAIAEATCEISHQLSNYVEHSYAGSQNASGDHQLELDIACDQEVFSAARRSGVIATVASEETPEETCILDLSVAGVTPPSENETGEEESSDFFSLACDPLDGSSIIDANFSVGSIYGLWPGTTLVGRTGREQVAAAVAVYGPRTLLCIAVASHFVIEITLVDDRTAWHISQEQMTLLPIGKIFAPGNLRATTDHPKYKALVEYWMEQRYQLRYTGGMVPDVYHMLVKGKGIFTNVSSPTAKAKLRLLYEVAPLGLIIECCGGCAIDADSDTSVLDIVIDHCDHRLGVCFGGKEEVEIYKKFMFN
jgi:sedoheptulose-bisphosphatase